jgi:hypothetical protein
MGDCVLSKNCPRLDGISSALSSDVTTVLTNVAQHQPYIRTDPPLVHADLPATENPVDVALGNALEHAGEEIVDPLPGSVGADRKPVNRFLA